MAPYVQVPLWELDFIRKGTCPAVNGTRRCRNKRTCDRRGHGKSEQEQVNFLCTELLTEYDGLSELERNKIADMLAKLVLCAGCCEEEKKNVFVSKMISQLDTKFAIKGDGVEEEEADARVDSALEESSSSEEEVVERAGVIFSRSEASTSSPATLSSSPFDDGSSSWSGSIYLSSFPAPPTSTLAPQQLSHPSNTPSPVAQATPHAAALYPTPEDTPTRGPRQSSLKPRPTPTATSRNPSTTGLILQVTTLTDALTDALRDLSISQLKARAAKSEADKWRSLYIHMRELSEAHDSSDEDELVEGISELEEEVGYTVPVAKTRKRKISGRSASLARSSLGSIVEEEELSPEKTRKGMS